MTLERTAAKKANSHFSVRFQCPNQHATEWNYKTLLENSYDRKTRDVISYSDFNFYLYQWPCWSISQVYNLSDYIWLYFLMLCMDSGAQSSENKSFQYAVS